MSLICGFRMERGKARPETAALMGGQRERSKRQNREEPSTKARRRDGRARSSDEAPVMGVERRDRIARGLFVRSTGRGPGGAA